MLSQQQVTRFDDLMRLMSDLRDLIGQSNMSEVQRRNLGESFRVHKAEATAILESDRIRGNPVVCDEESRHKANMAAILDGARYVNGKIIPRDVTSETRQALGGPFGGPLTLKQAADAYARTGSIEDYEKMISLVTLETTEQEFPKLDNPPPAKDLYRQENEIWFLRPVGFLIPLFLSLLITGLLMALCYGWF